VDPSGGISAETAAWIAVVGTALGALIGATTGGLVDFVLERLREARDAKVGARLVRLDLALAASQMKEAEDTGQWWVFFDTKMEGWAAHRASLAARLSDEDFETVTQSVAELERFGADMKQAPLEPNTSFRALSPSSIAPLRKMRTNATLAYDALARLAKGERSAGLLHEAVEASPERE